MLVKLQFVNFSEQYMEEHLESFVYADKLGSYYYLWNLECHVGWPTVWANPFGLLMCACPWVSGLFSKTTEFNF